MLRSFWYLVGLNRWDASDSFQCEATSYPNRLSSPSPSGLGISGSGVSGIDKSNHYVTAQAVTIRADTADVGCLQTKQPEQAAGICLILATWYFIPSIRPSHRLQPHYTTSQPLRLLFRPATTLHLRQKPISVSTTPLRTMPLYNVGLSSIIRV